MQALAASRPDLHEQIIAHPNVYPELITWIQQHRQVPSSSSPAGSPSRGAVKKPHGYQPLWIALAVIVVFALVGGGIWWSYKPSNGQYDEALAGLQSSITQAEQSVLQAQTALDKLSLRVDASADSEVTELITKADGAITAVKDALDKAQQTLALAQTQGSSKKTIDELNDASNSLVSLTASLDEVTGSVEEITDELQTAPGSAPESESEPEPELEPEPETAACTAPVAGTYPCAGRAIPADAQPLPATGGQYYVRTPSRNILCLVQEGSSQEAACQVLNWDGGGENNGVRLGSSGPALPAAGDFGAAWEIEAPTAAYRTVWHVGNFVFASSQDGLTVWNAKSGYGALINRNAISTFGSN